MSAPRSMSGLMPIKPLIRPGKLVPFTFGASVKGWHNILPFTICPKEFQMGRVRQIRPRSPFIKDALGTGSILHVARAQWFNDKYDAMLWRKAVDTYITAAEADAGRKFDPASKATATTTFEAYLNYWRVRPKLECLAVEYEVKPRALTKDAPEWAWRGARLDSIERDSNGVCWVGELKSTSRGASQVTDMYLLNGQTMLQAALWGPEEEDYFGPLGGILLDIVKKPSGKEEARAYPRVKLPLAQMQNALSWFKRDFTTWVMQSSLIDWNTTVERRPVCQRAYGPCDYKDLCLLGKDGAHMFTVDDKPLSDWSPVAGKEVPPWS